MVDENPKQKQKPNLYHALFQESSFLWDGIMNGDPQVLSDLIAHESQKIGQKNVLSKALYSCWIHMSCTGTQIPHHLLDRISFIAKHLISRVNEYDAGGYTPLMRAVQCGHLQAIQTLLSRVPHDVDIDASAEDDTIPEDGTGRITAAELAMIGTSTPQWNQLNQQVIEKCEWHAVAYRPKVTLIIQELDRDQFVGFGNLGRVILGFLFQNHEYKCKTLDSICEDMYLLVINQREFL
jgi:Ankyrin repeat